MRRVVVGLLRPLPRRLGMGWRHHLHRPERLPGPVRLLGQLQRHHDERVQEHLGRGLRRHLVRGRVRAGERPDES